MRPVILDAVFWSAALSCAIAQFFILRAVLRPPAVPDEATRTPGDASLPIRRQSGRVQEIVWAVLPAFLLTAAFVLAWRNMHGDMHSNLLP
ncbi:MAG TPA: hypothetical protein VE869_12680 [Gemmatimonas sp.]|nr:hypothetical protein [Gemmatimonas sp.]